ncbi:TetR/AcrR family transcriptional regulator [Brevibacterium luteolum]|uniref:TetR/AcrR family transcriptional regulator n=1 Tax=Brevibacterium luteolum TaxID=199591 RepID=UPI001C248C3A|nr:TetR/AcrR family transcriptional regulator [Brevibacterium luteolum]MBU8579018.1 TetR/AcrR family transcriptional regulator [Brevibacterium luteolum]
MNASAVPAATHSPSGGVRAAAKAQRREAILEAAKGLFARRGFHAVGIEDIGTGAGISGPAVYRHFASKEAILIELLVGISDYLHTGGRELLAEAIGASGADALIGRLVDFHVDFALREPELIRIQDRDFTALPDEARHRVRQLQRQYVTLWAEQLTALDPALSLDEATVRVHAVFGMINSTPYVARRIDRDIVRAQLLTGARASLGLPAQ